MSEEQRPKTNMVKQTERQTMELLPDKMSKLIRKATPENARATLPIDHPPLELLEETAAKTDPPLAKPEMPLRTTEKNTEPCLYVQMNEEHMVWIESENEKKKKKKSTQIFG